MKNHWFAMGAASVFLPLRDGVSVFMKSLNNHQHQEAVIGSKVETLTQVGVCLRCKLPVIAFFIFTGK